MRRPSVVFAVLALALLAPPAVLAPAAHAAGTSRSYLLRERLCLLQAYVERYANEHFNYYPPEPGVRKGGVLTTPLWPLNPWTGQAMKAGTGRGDYVYTRSASKLAYRLTARSPGGVITLTGAVPSTRKLQNDHRGREGLELIQQYIEHWASTHDGLYPDVAQVDAKGDVGLQEGIPFWPHDPWVHKGMRQATSWGNFTYTVNAAHDRYTIAVHYALGGTFTLSGRSMSSPWQQLRLALNDQILKRDLSIVDGYVRLYAALHGAPPAGAQLDPAGTVGLAHPDWPSAPYAGGPFTQGEGVGHFSYNVSADGSYVLSAPLATSTEPFTIEGGITTGPLQAPGSEQRTLGEGR